MSDVSVVIGDEVMFMTAELNMPNNGVCHSGTITKIFIDQYDWIGAVEIEYLKAFLFFRWKRKRIFLVSDVIGKVSEKQKEIERLERLARL